MSLGSTKAPLKMGMKTGQKESKDEPVSQSSQFDESPTVSLGKREIRSGGEERGKANFSCCVEEKEKAVLFGEPSSVGLEPSDQPDGIQLQ